MNVDLAETLRHVVRVPSVFDIADGSGLLPWRPELSPITEGKNVSISVLSGAGYFASSHNYGKEYWKEVDNRRR
jgi:hypothetical protein